MNSTIKDMIVQVHGKSDNPTKMNLTSGKFSMIIDEPSVMGGTDDGPSPVQVLLMSLAGCLNVTGHAVANQKGLKLNSMEIKIEGVLNPAAFMGISFEERTGFKEIHVSVKADIEDATQEEISSWLEETENRCPVTDNLKSTTTISITSNLK